MFCCLKIMFAYYHILHKIWIQQDINMMEAPFLLLRKFFCIESVAVGIGEVRMTGGVVVQEC